VGITTSCYRLAECYSSVRRPSIEREGKHGARSTKQAIAIGLSKARRAGVKLPPPNRGSLSAKTRVQASRKMRTARTSRRSKPSRTRSRAISATLRREAAPPPRAPACLVRPAPRPANGDSVRAAKPQGKQHAPAPVTIACRSTGFEGCVGLRVVVRIFELACVATPTLSSVSLDALV